MPNKSREDLLKELLMSIDERMGENLLDALSDPEACSPQLYTAVNTYLKRHDFSIKELEPNEELLDKLQQQALSVYSSSVAEDGLTEDEEFVSH